MNRERLRSFRSARYELRQLKDQLAEMEARMYAPKGQQFSSTPHGPGGNGRTMENLTAAHIKLAGLYNDKLLRLEMEQYDIERALEALEPTEKRVIRCRYLEGRSWEQISRIIHYEWAQTHRVHAAALRKLEAEEQKIGPLD